VLQKYLDGLFDSTFAFAWGDKPFFCVLLEYGFKESRKTVNTSRCMIYLCVYKN
jgi:hypothetical protein